ncbi:MAG: hypothetical protein ACOCZL_03955 [Bacteroidota bacterium]
MNFTKGEYQGDYQNWGIDVGSDSFVYVANNRGLLVYDGITWESYFSERITNLRSVRYDSSSKRIYTSGYREMGYWEWDDKGYLSYTSLTHLAASRFVANEEFWNIHIYQGKPVFHSFRGLFIYEDGDFRVIRTDGFFSGLSAIGKDLFVLINGKGIYRLGDVDLEPFMADEFFQDKYLVAFFPWNKEQYMIITAESGIFITDRYSYLKAFIDEEKYFNDNSINRAHMLDSSRIILGTILDGISLIEGENITLQVDQNCGLLNNTVLGISGKKDIVWLALDRGISLVKLENQSPIEFYHLPDIGAVYCGAVFNQKLYLGTNQGLYVSQDSPPYENFSLISGTQGQTWDCRVIDDHLFVGHNTGTFAIKGNNLQHISRIGGGFNIVQNPHRKHSLLQSTYSYFVLYSKDTNSQWKIEQTLPGFANLIRYIEFDQEGELWASHMHRAIYRIWLNNLQDSISGFKYYGLNSVFQKDKNVHVFKINGQIIFTTGNKLYTYDPIRDTIIQHDRYNKMLKEFAAAHRIIPSGNQHYWMISKNGVALFDFQNTEIRQLQFFPSPLFSGKTIDGFENIIPIDDHRAIYCLTDGIAILDAKEDFKGKIDSTRVLQLKRLSEFNRNGENISFSLSNQGYKIPASTDHISIAFSYPYHSDTQPFFKYRILGLNDTWKDAENPSEINIFRLPHGNYQIEILAEDLWKNRSKPLIIDLQVLAPWYISKVAWGIYFILLLALIFLVRYQFLKTLKRREKERMKKNEIELAKLRNQNLRTELSLKSRELANSTMAIIRKNELLLRLKSILKKQKQELGNRYPEKYYQEVIQKINQNISGGDDWKVFETNLEKAHELFLQKMIWNYPELTHSDLRLCTYLRMNLSSKEIAPLMRVSVRAIENHRYRLRKKLKLPRDVILNEFIIGIKV